MRLGSTEIAIEELEGFRRAGGDSIVDLSPKGDAADPGEVRRVARATGLNIIHGTAFYTEAAHPAHVADSSTAEIADEFIRDITEGFPGTDVRAGIVGEIGLSGTITDEEERVLRAGAKAAVETGVSLNIHPPLFGPEPAPTAALNALDIIEEVGLPLERTVVSHMDQNHHAMQDIGTHRQIAERGAYVEFDQWYLWQGYLECMKQAYPSDSKRVDVLLELIDEGYVDQLLLGHDVCTKTHLASYGGKGYTFLHGVLLPWLRDRELSREHWRTIMRENPRRLLTVEPH